MAAGVVAVLATAVIFGWLLWPTPPGPMVMRTGTSRYVVTATIDTPRIGTSAVEIVLTARAGGPSPPATVEIESVMPLMGHAASPILAPSVGDGRYRAEGVPLMMTGPWELALSIDAPGEVEHLTLPLWVSG